MSRRHPRLSECRTMDDLVRGGFAEAVVPTTDTGYKSYGTGRLFLPAGAEDASVLSSVPPDSAMLPTNMHLASTIAMRCVPQWAGNDAATHSFVLLTNADVTAGLFIDKNSGNKFIVGQRDITGWGLTQVESAAMSFSSGTTHRMVARVTAGTSADLTVDGTASAQGVAGILSPGAFSYLFIGSWSSGGQPSESYIGPLVLCPQRITDAETVALDAGLAAGWGGVELFRFFRERGYRGTLVIPLDGDSASYRIV